jgi:hypothetical protein
VRADSMGQHPWAVKTGYNASKGMFRNAATSNVPPWLACGRMRSEQGLVRGVLAYSSLRSSALTPDQQPSPRLMSNHPQLSPFNTTPIYPCPFRLWTLGTSHLADTRVVKLLSFLRRSRTSRSLYIAL